MRSGPDDPETQQPCANTIYTSPEMVNQSIYFLFTQSAAPRRILSPPLLCRDKPSPHHDSAPRCLFRPPSVFVAGDHQFMVEVKFCPWDGKYAQSTSVTHTPSAPSSAVLTSPKPWVIHEPLPCETEWPTQAKLTSPSVLMEPFVTATSCISASAANSLGSDRGVSEYRQLLIYSLIITCLICRADTMLPFSHVRVSHFVFPAICWLGISVSGFLCVCRPQNNPPLKFKLKSSIILITSFSERSLFRWLCATSTLFNRGVSIAAYKQACFPLVSQQMWSVTTLLITEKV